MTRSLRDGSCPVTHALDVFGDRWSLLIIRDILFKGRSRYGDFLEAPEGISTSILASRLRHLSDMGIIRKVQHDGRPAYQLTDRGLDLVPVVVEMVVWSATHDPQPDAPSSIIYGAPADFLERAANDRGRLVREIQDASG